MHYTDIFSAQLHILLKDSVVVAANTHLDIFFGQS